MVIPPHWPFTILRNSRRSTRSSMRPNEQRLLLLMNPMTMIASAQLLGPEFKMLQQHCEPSATWYLTLILTWNSSLKSISSRVSMLTLALRPVHNTPTYHMDPTWFLHLKHSWITCPLLFPFTSHGIWHLSVQSWRHSQLQVATSSVSPFFHLHPKRSSQDLRFESNFKAKSRWHETPNLGENRQHAWYVLCFHTVCYLWCWHFNVTKWKIPVTKRL